jgi:WD40 repeat protein
MEQVQCLAFSPDGAYLAIGLESGIVRLLKMEKYETPTSSNLFLTGDLPVVCLSFSADASELVASVRDGSEVHVKTSPRPFVNLDKYYLDRPIPEVRWLSLDHPPFSFVPSSPVADQSI